MLSSDGAAFTVEESCGLFSCSRSDDLSHSKTPPSTQVHRSLLRARLYHNSRGIGILEVTIRKNAESGPENFKVLRRESGRSHLAMLLRPKAGRGCGLGRGGHRTGDMDASSPGTLGIKRNSTEQKSPLKLKMYSISTNTHIAN